MTQRFSSAFLFVALLTTTLLSHASAQTDFFMSLNGLHTGAVNSDLIAEVSPGESGKIYIYYTTNGPADSNLGTGAFLDISSSQAGVIRFTSARTLDFQILLLGTPFGVRWGDSFGPANSVTDQAINELGAFTLFTGRGLLEAHNGSSGLIDAGYDAAADAFLFAEIEYIVAADAIPGSSTLIEMQRGSGSIVNNGAVVPATFGIADLSIAVKEIMGDINGDGIVSTDDVGPFVQIIVNRQYMTTADINGDGVVDLRDVRPFIKLIAP